ESRKRYMPPRSAAAPGSAKQLWLVRLGSLEHIEYLAGPFLRIEFHRPRRGLASGRCTRHAQRQLVAVQIVDAAVHPAFELSWSGHCHVQRRWSGLRVGGPSSLLLSRIDRE